jgi:hypothetical protein
LTAVFLHLRLLRNDDIVSRCPAFFAGLEVFFLGRAVLLFPMLCLGWNVVLPFRFSGRWRRTAGSLI